ncbi:MAG: methyltransferase domain-containing protein, partial [Candidatus Eisenbacteria bacterium]
MDLLKEGGYSELLREGEQDKLRHPSDASHRVPRYDWTCMTETTRAFDAEDDHDVSLWDELPLWSALAGQLLLEHVPLTAQRALDLGCGTGFPLLELAERLGPRAHVVGVDPWRAAMRRAAAKRAAWPVGNTSLLFGNGARLPFRAATFNLVVSNLGVNNFAEPDVAFSECRRVLRPQGTLALSTNLAGHFDEFYATFEEVLTRLGDHSALARLHAHVGHRHTIESLGATLERHGLHLTGTHRHEAVWRFRDGSALLAHHFIRLGILPGWQEVAGGVNANSILDAL